MPESIYQAIEGQERRALGYCDFRGMEEARQKIAAYHRSRGLVDINENDVFIGNGVSEVVNFALQSLLNEGDEVLVPTPCYSLWNNTVHLCGAKPVFYICDERSDWNPDCTDIRSKITPKTKAIVLINPNNPTGVVYSNDIQLQIAEIARQNDLIIFSDEIYDRLVMDGLTHTSIAALAPNGCFYVGTQSEFRLGLSDKIDGKLYRITPDGAVALLLDGLILANGMDWSPDERFFYLADTGAKKVREYEFDKNSDNLTFTGREAHVSGADGLTVDKNGTIFVASWGKSCIAIIDPKTMQIHETISVPTKAPASCAFFGKEMDQLVITTASFGIDTDTDRNAGYLMIKTMHTQGRLPYLFGETLQ